jgi:hypothetical protein
MVTLVTMFPAPFSRARTMLVGRDLPLDGAAVGQGLESVKPQLSEDVAHPRAQGVPHRVRQLCPLGVIERLQQRWHGVGERQGVRGFAEGRLR